MILIEYMDSILYNMESVIQKREDFRGIETSSLEGQWSDIQLVCSRCKRFIKDLSFILLQFRIPLDDPLISRRSPWTDSKVDFQYIYKRLTSLQERADLCNQSLTSVTGIIGNARALTEAKRSIREAKTVKTLTLIAMVFIPLGFTTGIFSMSEEYLPGKKDFWVFFSVSIPIVVVVFIIAFVIDLGYDVDGNWGFKTFLIELAGLPQHLHGVIRDARMARKDSLGSNSK